MLFAACGLSAAGGSGAQGAQAGEVELSELGKFDLETLLDIEVTSVSKKEERLSQTAAAIYVITQEDIRRSGLTSLPEIFRMVPGMQVARVGANQWAISSRGFNGTYSNKLLVLVDGRTVYTPSFGGVFWSDQDLMLEDLERVEVIRGPGATLWGANAFNGVINIISKKARDTQGLLLSTSYGTLEQPLTNLRYGGQIGTNLHYRVYGRYLNHTDFEDASGSSMGDDWRIGSGGLRLDWEPTENDVFTLQGDYRQGTVGALERVPQLTPPYSQRIFSDHKNTGANILGRWTHTFSEESDFSIQAYYDRIEHGELVGAKTREETFDLELQQRFWLGERHELIWGGGYRYLPGEQTVGLRLGWTDTETHHQLANIFVQDAITIVEDRLKFTLGSKFEHNDYTGLEIQPSARLLYTPTERQSIWAAASRAVRIPARVDTSAIVNLDVIPPTPDTPPILSRLRGDSEFGAEEVYAFELGYRVRPHPRVSLDAAGFFNVLDGIRYFVPGTPYLVTAPSPHLIVDATARRYANGFNYGAELSADWAVTDIWRLHAGYSWIDQETDSHLPLEESTPEHQLHLRSYLDLPHQVQLTAAAYYVDQIAPSDGVQEIPIDSYVRLDVGVTWRPHPSLELGIWGQNLLDQGHPEFANFRSQQATEVPRSVVGRITWSY